MSLESIVSAFFFFVVVSHLVMEPVERQVIQNDVLGAVFYQNREEFLDEKQLPGRQILAT